MVFSDQHALQFLIARIIQVIYNHASSRENRLPGSMRTALDQIFLQRHVYPLCMIPLSFYIAIRSTAKARRAETQGVSSFGCTLTNTSLFIPLLSTPKEPFAT